MLVMLRKLAMSVGAAALLGAGSAMTAETGVQPPRQDAKTESGAATAPGNLAVATFAGGCFWCMEPPYDKLPGVVSTVSGYIGGHVDNPSYRQVTRGDTGHYEALQVTYDPAKIGYEKLLDVFWRNVDPLDDGGQFCDRGPQYRTGIFYHDEEQKRLAERSKMRLDGSKVLDNPIVTEIMPAPAFYPAEDYHQDYYRKNPLRYKYYRYSCGRDRRLEQLWGASSPPA